MKKNAKKIIIASILTGIIFLVGFSITLLKQKNPTGSILHSSSATLLKICKPELVQKINVSRGGGSAPYILEFNRIPGNSALQDFNWHLGGILEGEADVAKAERLVSDLCIYTRAIMLQEKVWPKLMAENKPKIEIESAEGKIKIEFGKLLGGTHRALRIERGRVQVVLVPEKFLSIVSLAPAEFQNKKIASMQLDNMDIVRVFSNGKSKFQLVREGADWSLEPKVRVDRKSKREAVKFIHRISSLSATEVVRQEISLEECKRQLRGKRVYLDIDGIGKTKEKILIGKKDAQNTFACSSRRQALFRVHEDFWKYLSF